MNDEQFRDLLADYLAGELDEQQVAAFRTELQANPQRRKLADELQAAAAALEANVPSHAEAERRTQSLRLMAASTLRARDAIERAAAPPRQVRPRTTLRYAAVIILAFGAGFAVRGWQSGERPGTPPVATPATINEHYVAKFVEATQSYPASSTFSRLLLTLARK